LEYGQLGAFLGRILKLYDHPPAKALAKAGLDTCTGPPYFGSVARSRRIRSVTDALDDRP
jgi:hypothetical protein